MEDRGYQVEGAGTTALSAVITSDLLIDSFKSIISLAMNEAHKGIKNPQEAVCLTFYLFSVAAFLPS